MKSIWDDSCDEVYLGMTSGMKLNIGGWLQLYFFSLFFKIAHLVIISIVLAPFLVSMMDQSFVVS